MSDATATTIPATDHVPGRAHYSLHYLRDGRVFSFAHQINSVLSFEPQSVLEVGVGPGVVTAALRAAGLQVTTLDIQPELKPDLFGSVTDVPVPPASFDVVVCSQVLEHLPFDQFAVALREFRRVARMGVVLSLPDVSPHYYVSFRLPRLPKLFCSFSIRRRRPVEMSPSRLEATGHHWEIGYRSSPLRLVTRTIQEAGWRIAATWRVPEKHWHRFFRLVRRNDKPQA